MVKREREARFGDPIVEAMPDAELNRPLEHSLNLCCLRAPGLDCVRTNQEPGQPVASAGLTFRISTQPASLELVLQQSHTLIRPSQRGMSQGTLADHEAAPSQ